MQQHKYDQYIFTILMFKSLEHIFDFCFHTLGNSWFASKKNGARLFLVMIFPFIYSSS